MFRRLVVPLFLVFLLSACGTVESASPPASPPVTTGALSGSTADGETISLADFRGTPVFINVWSSW